MSFFNDPANAIGVRADWADHNSVSLSPDLSGRFLTFPVGVALYKAIWQFVSTNQRESSLLEDGGNPIETNCRQIEVQDVWYTEHGAEPDTYSWFHSWCDYSADRLVQKREVSRTHYPIHYRTGCESASMKRQP